MTDHEPDAPSDYLWDGTGVPDEEIVRLEETLRPLRHQGTLPSLPNREAGRRRVRWISAPWLAAAAALVLLVGGVSITLMLRSADWSVSSLSGAPAVDGRAVTTRARMSRGDWLVTDNGSRARVAVGGIGTVEVEPNTRAAAGRERSRAPHGTRARHDPRADLGAAQAVRGQHRGGDRDRISAAPTPSRWTRTTACCG